MEGLKILVVEDEFKVANLLKQGLEEQGYKVQLADDGQEAISLILKNSYDIAILDVNVPYINGIELCRVIKNNRSEIPVLMLTALGTTDDKEKGFDAGADDYLVKPFEFKELLMRIKALLRRSNKEGIKQNKLRLADLELDLNKKIAIRGDKNIELTAKEFALLEYLMRNNGRVISRVDISEKVWDLNFDTGTNVVEVYINILRKKIDKDHPKKLIHTRIGMGYIMEEV